MKLKKILKSATVCLAMAIILLPAMPTLQVNAAAKAIETKYINGNGVRLRKEGWSGGTVLELMYDGDEIRFYPDIYGSDTEYNYMQRVSTKTYGYVDHHYTRNHK